MLDIFNQAGKKNSQNTRYQFWQQNNPPIEVSETNKIDKALAYIPENPVKAGWVAEPQDYLYGSARNHTNKGSKLKVTSIFEGVII